MKQSLDGSENVKITFFKYSMILDFAGNQISDGTFT